MYFPPTVTQSYEVKYGETEMGVGTVTGADVIGGFTGFNAESMKKAMGAAWRASNRRYRIGYVRLENGAGVCWC